MTQRVGPKVRVRIEYECNGCEFLSIADDTINDDHGNETTMRYHCCNHPSVISEYKCPQWLSGGRTELTLYHIAATPDYLCPYLKDK